MKYAGRQRSMTYYALILCTVCKENIVTAFVWNYSHILTLTWVYRDR